MYPEKAILDVAGFPTVKGRALVAGLAEQAAVAVPTYLLDPSAPKMNTGAACVSVGPEIGITATAKAGMFPAGTRYISPRPPPAAAECTGRGARFSLTTLASH